MARLTSRFQVDLLVRQAQAAGGFAMVLHKGDKHGGALMVQCRDRGQMGALMERRWTMDGGVMWDAVGPSESTSEDQQNDYLAKRLRNDPDLWVVELDIANAAQLVVSWLSNA
jgi:hypothetical protein